ncbi:hypothetical protein SRB5_56860 [Streptomyces sp. RB5]|uniref:Uncharacterized protein n=1 Tax=Streptomyces smaragdinus TaxID=2585196 RepID=A0A7K0CRZ5_9ACTN|nr:hypothetical protein [Streptomyces smaragdinus]MQY15504.1 hypothetical protein [Streptomyces smaragdinus]
MPTETANGISPLSFWPRVRAYAVPPSMIEKATARRRAGDWAGACVAAGVDVDLNLRAAADAYGRELATAVRADLRHLAPDLLRWHLPRIAPDGLLRPGLTLPLARYDPGGVRLVVRTPPAWAEGGQRVSLTLWDPRRPADGAFGHPHARPGRRFRFDLHRHLWDTRRSGELRERAGAGDGSWRAVDRWGAEAALVLRDQGRAAGSVLVRLAARERVLVDVGADGAHTVRGAPDGPVPALPVLPDAATWTLPDLALLRAGAIAAGELHPLVAAALAPDDPVDVGGTRDAAGQPRVVECRGARHRIGLVDGVLTALDHDPAEVRREELLMALTGTPLPCLRAIDRAHRRPQSLTDVRERLDHGDFTGALSVVEGLLGPAAVLRDGPLRDELEAAAERRIAYGLFRAGLAEPGRKHSVRQLADRDRRPHRRKSATR